MNSLGKKKLNYLKRNFFLNPSGENADVLLHQASIALKNFIEKQGDSPTFPKHEIYEEKVGRIKSPIKSMRELFNYFGGSIKSNHPLLLRNVIPLPNFVSINTRFITSLLMANGVTSDDSGNILIAEKNTSNFLAELIGIKKEKSIGFFTWGGTATAFYGLKSGLQKAAPFHTKEGVTPKKIVVLSSWTGHYCQNTATNWLGIGEENIVYIKSNFDHTTNLDDLECKMRECVRSKKRIAAIFCTGGSSANGSIDDVKKIFKIRKKIIKEFSLDYIPHIHVDSVSGWIYLVFKGYDFKRNPYGFDKKVCLQIKKILSKILLLKYGDSFGFDFHKTGYCPYNSTVFLSKDKRDLDFLAKDSNKIAPLFHSTESQNSNGFLYTMETSRSSANILSTWIGVKTIGIEGFQLLIGKGLENTNYLKELLSSDKAKKAGFWVINKILFGNTLHLRIYNKDPSVESKNELIDKKKLEENNNLTKEFFDFLDKSKKYSKKISLSCSRGSFYLDKNIKGRGIRIYFLNPFTDKYHVLELFKILLEAHNEFKKKCH